MADIAYYILFENHGEALALREELLAAGIENRIAPAPYALLGEVSCGISLLIKEDAIEAVRNFLADRPESYHSIAELENPIQPKRDRYC